MAGEVDVVATAAEREARPLMVKVTSQTKILLGPEGVLPLVPAQLSVSVLRSRTCAVSELPVDLGELQVDFLVCVVVNHFVGGPVGH